VYKFLFLGVTVDLKEQDLNTHFMKDEFHICIIEWGGMCLIWCTV